MGILNKKKEVSSIPILEVYDDGLSSKKPLVIILHGFLGQKEENLEFAHRLANDGFFVILPDAFLHGEQKNNEYEQVSMFKKIGKIDEIFLNTTEYINIIIDSYGDSEADTGRIGLIGISMGGCIIYNYLARYNNPGVKAAVPIIATPYWYNHITQDAIETEMPEATKYISEDLLQRISSIEPSNKLKNINTPLLMLNGETDSLIPIEDVRKTYKFLKNNYNDANQINFVEYSGADHFATQDMFREAAKWIKTFV